MGSAGDFAAWSIGIGCDGLMTLSLTGDSIPLAKTAFQRVFERVSFYWETVSPRRLELVRAEITPRFPFCLTVGTSRKAHGQTKRETLVLNFKTSKQNQMDRIVATLERLYSGKPIGSPTLGLVCRMEHAQVLKYLHRAKEAGRVTPILNVPGPGRNDLWLGAVERHGDRIAGRTECHAGSIRRQTTCKERQAGRRGPPIERTTSQPHQPGREHGT